MPDSLTHLVTVMRSELDAMLAAPVLGIGDEPLAVLSASVAVQAHAGDLVAASAQRAKAAGSTWQQLGDVLGISRQAAFQRFGKPLDPRTGDVMNTTPLPDAADLADTVIRDLAQSSWSAVAARFDLVVAERLSSEGLAAAWAQVVGTVGAYEGHGEVEVARAADFTVTDTPLAFEAGDIVARISFRDDRTIAGLYLLPQESAR